MLDTAAVQEDEEVAAEDEEDMGVIETYSNYKPTKLMIGLPHPDAVVETASLASVEPADVWYELSLPAEVEFVVLRFTSEFNFTVCMHVRLKILELLTFRLVR